MKISTLINNKILNNINIFRKLLDNKFVIILFLVLFVFSTRIPGIYAGKFTPDSITYYDIAKNIDDGSGFKMSFRMNYLNDWQNIQHYEYENPPLYPLFLSFFPSYLDSFQKGIFLNVLLCISLVILIYLFSERLFNRRIALISAILIALNPLVFSSSVIPWSEMLFLLLTILAIYLLTFYDDYKTYAAAGIFSGLAYLTRYNGILIVFAAFILISYMKREKARKKRFYNLIFYSIFFIIVISPWLIRNYLLFLNPFFSYQSYTLFLSPSTSLYFDFFPLHPEKFYMTILPGLLIKNAIQYIYFLFDFSTFGLFLPFVIISIQNYQKNTSKFLSIVLSVLTIGFFFFKVESVEMRYLILPVILMIPFGIQKADEILGSLSFDFSILNKKKSIRIFSLFAIVTIVLWGYASIQESRYISYDSKIRDEEEKETATWLLLHSNQSEVVGSSHPWFTFYYSGGYRNITIVPNLNETELSDFIQNYSLKFIVIDHHFDWTLISLSESIFKPLKNGKKLVLIGNNTLKLEYVSPKKNMYIYEIQSINTKIESISYKN